MSPPAAPRDRRDRLSATTVLDRNVVVTAGAGTGKTSLLVERLLVALGRGATTLDAVAAITFTDKAAGELRHRLAAGLDALEALGSGASLVDPPGEAIRAFAHLTESEGVAREAVAARAAAALPDLDRASVTTIHGFCADILRSHPVEAGLPPGFRVERGPVVDRIAEELWAEFVSEELGPGGTRPALWSAALAAVSMSGLAALGRDLARGATPSSLLARPYAAADRVLRDEAARVAAAIRDPAARIADLNDAPREWFEGAASALGALATDGPESARDVRARAERLRGPLGEIGKKVAAGAKARLKEIARDAWAIVRGLDDLDEAGIAAAVETVRPYARRVREAFARAGLVDFDTLLVGARDLLRDDPVVRERVKARLRMLLIDEFQDTDPVQYEVVFLLAEVDGGGASDPWATRLAPGRLFIVGDAKQSIYRFRGADYAAYRRAVAHVLDQGGLALSLTSSFRSRPEVLGPVNALFAPSPASSWEASAVLPAYEAVVAEREASGMPAVEIWTTPESAGPAGARRRAEAKALAGAIAAMVAEGGGRRYRDVLVLLRSFSELSTYLRALREAEVPFVVDGGKDFHERTEIVQAIAVLRAVEAPDDPIARLAFLRSPAGGVPDDEIARFAAGRDAWSEAPVPDPVHAPRVAAALAALAALREEAAPLPVDLAIRRILERSGLVPLNALSFDGAQRVANLEKLATDAAALARDGRFTFRETIDALAERPRGEEEGESPLSDETADVVRVMTVHKAKGLEAPIVVLADVAAGRRHRDTDRSLSAAVVRTGGIEAIAVSGPGLVNAAALAAAVEDARHEAAEDLRLLYVALTRARDRLVVLAGGRRAEPWTRALAPWGYDPKEEHGDGEALDGGRVTHRILVPGPRVAAPARGAEPGSPAAAAAFERACARARESVSTVRFPSAYERRSRADAEDAGAAPLDPPLARAVGSVVHARLERFAGDAADLVHGLAAEARGPAAEHGVDPDAVAAEARAVLEAFAASPLSRRLAEIEILGREVPVLWRESETTTWHGTIDLLYRDSAGSLVVADYKTDADIEGALARHHGQLRVYMEAIRRAIPASRVRAELWMLRWGQVLNPVILQENEG